MGYARLFVAMKVLKISLLALVFLALFTLVVIMPSLGGSSVGTVGGWVWKAMWALLGVVGAGIMLLMGGGLAFKTLWRRSQHHEGRT